MAKNVADMEKIRIGDPPTQLFWQLRAFRITQPVCS